MICVHADRKASVAFYANCLSELKYFSRLQARTNTMRALVAQKLCTIDTLLLQTTNRKCHMAYWIAPFLLTSNDIESHFAVARLTNGIRRTFVQHFALFPLTQCVARSLGDSWASIVTGALILPQKHRKLLIGPLAGLKGWGEITRKRRGTSRTREGKVRDVRSSVSTRGDQKVLHIKY